MDEDEHSTASLSTSLHREVMSKNDMNDVIHLQAVNENIKPSDDDYHSVTDSLPGMQTQMNNVTSNIQIICDSISCPCPCPSNDQNQGSHALLGETSDVLNSDKSMKLPELTEHQSHNNLGRDPTIPSDTSSLTTSLDTQQYYNQIHSQPIMVYSNILPFDSLVPVSSSLDKNAHKKVLDGINLLQSAVDVTDGVYSQHSRPLSPLYIVPDKIRGVYNKTHTTSHSTHSDISVPLESDFIYMANPNYDTSVAAESSMPNFTLQTDVYQTSTDTDSEVALTLASLGNLKPEEKNDKNCNELDNTLPDNSDVIKVASILSSVANQHQFNRLSTSWPETLAESNPDDKQESKSTLVLRSRRSRGTAPNPHYNDFTIEDPEKIGKKRKKKLTKLSMNKYDDNVLLKMSNGTILNMSEDINDEDNNQVMGPSECELRPKQHANENTSFSTSIAHPSNNNMTMQMCSNQHTTSSLSMHTIVSEPIATSIQDSVLTTTSEVSQPMMANTQIQPRNNAVLANESPKENLLGQLLKASEHCEPATLIPEGVVDDVIPAVGYRIMDMSNLSEMIQMMHRCSGSMGSIVIQEQASLREGAVSQLSIICTGCQEGTVCATSNKTDSLLWDINNRVEKLRKEYDIKEDQIQGMLEILGIFYRPCKPPPLIPPPEPLPVPSTVPQSQPVNEEESAKQKKKRKKKSDTNNTDVVPKKKNFECKVCKERFSGENHLKKHMNCHNYALHTCPYCHAYFKKPFNLQEHVKKHENFKFQCPHCSVAVTDRSTLRLHIKSLHEKKFLYQCSECAKKFYHKQHLNEHMRVHTKEKPYKCEICPKAFSWHDSLKKHMRTHIAGSKYECRLCGKWFRWLQAVRQHLQQQHKLRKCDIDAQIMTSSSETAPALPCYQVHNLVSSITLHSSHINNNSGNSNTDNNHSSTSNHVPNNFHSIENVNQENSAQEDLAMFTISDQNWPV